MVEKVEIYRILSRKSKHTEIWSRKSRHKLSISTQVVVSTFEEGEEYICSEWFFSDQFSKTFLAEIHPWISVIPQKTCSTLDISDLIVDVKTLILD